MTSGGYGWCYDDCDEEQEACDEDCEDDFDDEADDCLDDCDDAYDRALAACWSSQEPSSPGVRSRTPGFFVRDLPGGVSREGRGRRECHIVPFEAAVAPFDHIESMVPGGVVP
jgi:hypothetical protein